MERALFGEFGDLSLRFRTLQGDSGLGWSGSLFLPLHVRGLDLIVQWKAFPCLGRVRPSLKIMVSYIISSLGSTLPAMRFNTDILKVWDVGKLPESFSALPFNLNLFASPWFTHRPHGPEQNATDCKQ